MEYSRSRVDGGVEVDIKGSSIYKGVINGSESSHLIAPSCAVVFLFGSESGSWRSWGKDRRPRHVKALAMTPTSSDVCSFSCDGRQACDTVSISLPGMAIGNHSRSRLLVHRQCTITSRHGHQVPGEKANINPKFVIDYVHFIGIQTLVLSRVTLHNLIPNSMLSSCHPGVSGAPVHSRKATIILRHLVSSHLTHMTNMSLSAITRSVVLCPTAPTSPLMIDTTHGCAAACTSRLL